MAFTAQLGTVGSTLGSIEPGVAAIASISLTTSLAPDVFVLATSAQTAKLITTALAPAVFLLAASGQIARLVTTTLAPAAFSLTTADASLLKHLLPALPKLPSLPSL